MIQIYRVFNQVEEFSTDDDYLFYSGANYVVSILATDETSFYIYPDESYEYAHLAFNPEELEGRIDVIAEMVVRGGDELPFSPEGWAAIAATNLGRGTIKILVSETEDDSLISDVDRYESDAIRVYLERKAKEFERAQRASELS